MQPHILTRPPGDELVAAGRQLPDQVTERLVPRGAAGLDPQRPHLVISHMVPVDEEAAGVRIQKQVAGQVQRQPVSVEDTPVQGAAQLVRGQDVHPCRPHVGGDGGHAVQDGGDRRTRRSDRRFAPRGPWRRRPGVAGQVEQVDPLGVIQLQRAGHGLQHRLRRPRQVAALQPAVVVDAEPGEQRHLFASQTRHPPPAAVGRQARLLGAEPGPAAGQELLDVFAVIHIHDGRGQFRE